MRNNKEKSNYIFNFNENNDLVSLDMNENDDLYETGYIPNEESYLKNDIAKTRKKNMIKKTANNKRKLLNRKSSKSGKRRNLYLVLGLICILAFIIIFFVFIKGNFGKLEPAQEGIEAGSKIKDYVSLVKFKHENDEDKYKIEYVESNIQLDEVGSYPVKYLLTNKEDKQIIEEEVNINVIDTTPPEIISYEVIIDRGNEFNPQEMVEVIDNAKGDIEVNIENGQVNIDEIGSYGLKIRAKDASGNIATKNIKVFVKTGQSQFFSSLEVTGGQWIEEASNGLRKHIFFENEGVKFYKVDGINSIQVKITSMDVDVSGKSAILYGKTVSTGKTENIKVEIIDTSKKIKIMMYDSSKGGYGEDIILYYWQNNKIEKYKK